MNNENKQVAIFFAIIAVAISLVMKFSTDALATQTKAQMDNIKKDIQNEKLLAEKENKTTKAVEKEEALSSKDGTINQDGTSEEGKVSTGQTDNTNKDSSSKVNEELEEALGDTNTTEAVDKTAKDCYNKNGKLYYNGVCIPIPSGFKYVMKQEGFVAYADSNYTSIFMVYVKKHNMDVAKDGLEEFTYGFGAHSMIKDGPKKMTFGKNYYERYEIELNGVRTYAFITASSTKVAYIQLVSANGSVSWAKNSLTNLTYY